MRANKQFFVVAYDTPSPKRRRLFIKAIEPFGHRINLSVYELMLTPSQYLRMIETLKKTVIPGKDQVAIYRLCIDCFSKTRYLPSSGDRADIVTVF